MDLLQALKVFDASRALPEIRQRRQGSPPGPAVVERYDADGPGVVLIDGRGNRRRGKPIQSAGFGLGQSVELSDTGEVDYL